MRKFPLKIHKRHTNNKQQKKEHNRKPAHSSTLPHSLTYEASKSLLKRERMTEAGIEPAISGLFLTKIALNPKGGCFKIRILLVFFYT